MKSFNVTLKLDYLRDLLVIEKQKKMVEYFLRVVL